ncbi:MAG TPA: hypothetical protein VJ914_14765 [Pseudonocardiaceae bacterium]|nr:hypothetical protein [Pseudonocardiaceae bacterium]
MTSTDSLGTVEAQLRELVTLGFRFVHPRGTNGEVSAVVGVCAHDGFADVLVLSSESDAKAMRLPSDEKDVLAPSTVLWETSGSAPEVLAELLRLSHGQLPDSAQDHSADVKLRRSGTSGFWMPVAPGTTRWLTSSI